jgi:hypothetical protein
LNTGEIDDAGRSVGPALPGGRADKQHCHQKQKNRDNDGQLDKSRPALKGSLLIRFENIHFRQAFTARKSREGFGSRYFEAKGVDRRPACPDKPVAQTSRSHFAILICRARNDGLLARARNGVFKRLPVG